MGYMKKVYKNWAEKSSTCRKVEKGFWINPLNQMLRSSNV